jgi:penicillin-binding protein 1C
MTQKSRFPAWFRFKTLLHFWSGVGLLSLCLFFLLDAIFPFHVAPSYAKIIYDREGKILHTFLSQDEKWRFPAKLSQISPQLQKAIIEKEDQYFYYHIGFNPLAILRAMLRNLQADKRTSGASTITMQVARLAEPKKRTYLNKLVEIFRALQLEKNYSKDEILELYLNLVPYGSNIEGVRAASLIYFGTEPSQLSLAQTTLLAIVPNRPNSLALGQKNQSLLLAERNRWIKIFTQKAIFPTADLADALGEPLQILPRQLPRAAPHFSIRLQRAFPDQNEIYSTLNANFQARIERNLSSYIQKNRELGIHQAAVLVIDNRTREVVAYVGSADFQDKKNAGQVDGVQAVRSPGSTLKPLIYGLAFDKGLLTPKSKILDVPMDFDGYAPENFDRNFQGEVSVETALAYSLNLPAVETLNQLGVHTLSNALIESGFDQIAKDKLKLGLSLALGGCGVTLEELTGLFAAFANGGTWEKPHYTLAETKQKRLSNSLLSPQAAYMVSEILTQVQRPDMPSDYQNSKNVPKIAWKTGTSYGRRDAWCIGFNAHYTVGVWVGNFSGEGVAALTGASRATPLLFKIFTTIDYAPEKEELERPDGLKKRLVCSETGKVPNHFCTYLIEDSYIPTISKSDKCNHLKPVFVSEDESKSFCNHCLPEKGYKTAYYPNLSAELAHFKESRQIFFAKPPPHNPDCAYLGNRTGSAPRILLPSPEKTYLLLDSISEIPLVARTDADVKTIDWYLNDTFYGRTSPQKQLFFKNVKGRVKISCSDDKGRSSHIFITVE